MTEHLPPPRVIYDRLGAEPYLSRWYLTHRPTMPDGSNPMTREGNPRDGIVWPDAPVGVYLHRFHKGDDSDELHNHPWDWALSLILAGGYVEERRMGSRVVTRTLTPGMWNYIAADDYHRVDLLEGDSWSLFIVGRKSSSWGFWDRRTKETVPWREYITRVRGPGWSAS